MMARKKEDWRDSYVEDEAFVDDVKRFVNGEGGRVSRPVGHYSFPSWKGLDPIQVNIKRFATYEDYLNG